VSRKEENGEIIHQVCSSTKCWSCHQIFPFMRKRRHLGHQESFWMWTCWCILLWTILLPMCPVGVPGFRNAEETSCCLQWIPSG